MAQNAEAALSNSRAMLRREWALTEMPQLFAVRDVCGSLGSPGGVDVLAELIASLPAKHVLAVTTRSALPQAIQHIVGEAGGMVLGAADFALSLDEVVRLARAAGLDASAGQELYRVCNGWPLVCRLLIHLARLDDHGYELMRDVATLDEGALLAFVSHRTIARLDTVCREALAIAALLRSASHAQLIRIQGDICDDVVYARLAALPFVVASDDALRVHPEIVALLEQRFAHIVSPLYERTLSALAGDGAYAAAADVALRRGDIVRAAAIIDAAPSYISAHVPLADYERIIEQLDRGLITQFPNVWIATMPYRSFAVDRATFVREAETVYYCLPPTAEANQRARALVLLASALTNSGRRTEADRLLADAMQTFARPGSQARASLLGFIAWMNGNDGKFALARELAAEAASLSRHEFQDNQALHYIEVHEAAYRGQGDRVTVIIDELLRRDEAPLHRAFTAGNGALFAWVNGDDDTVLRYMATVEDALTPGLERGFRPLIDAARGRPVVTDDAYLWPVMRAVIHLFRLGNASTEEEALSAARQAARAADERGDPYTRVLAYSALFLLDSGSRDSSEKLLPTLVAEVESAEMKAAVHALLNNESPGILDRFVRRRVLRQQADTPPHRVVIELLAARITVCGRDVRVSEKEFELLALLGSAQTMLSRARIGEALWDHLDPEEWPNNLKVTLSRLRRRLGMRDVVLVTDGRYRLSPTIEVDLPRAEALLRNAAAPALEAERRESLVELTVACSSAGAVRYERYGWAHGLRTRIEAVACGASIALAKNALADGHLNEAIRFAGLAASVDPYDEAATEITIRSHIARGDADAARREYRRYAVALSRELGATPSLGLAKLVQDSAHATTESRHPKAP